MKKKSSGTSTSTLISRATKDYVDCMVSASQDEEVVDYLVEPTPEEWLEYKRVWDKDW